MHGAELSEVWPCPRGMERKGRGTEKGCAPVVWLPVVSPPWVPWRGGAGRRGRRVLPPLSSSSSLPAAKGAREASQSTGALLSGSPRVLSVVVRRTLARAPHLHKTGVAGLTYYFTILLLPGPREAFGKSHCKPGPCGRTQPQPGTLGSGRDSAGAPAPKSWRGHGLGGVTGTLGWGRAGGAAHGAGDHGDHGRAGLRHPGERDGGHWGSPDPVRTGASGCCPAAAKPPPGFWSQVGAGVPRDGAGGPLPKAGPRSHFVPLRRERGEVAPLKPCFPSCRESST